MMSDCAAHHALPRFRVLIAGGGVAALETAFALQDLAPDRVSCTMLAPSSEFTVRAQTIAEPFSRGIAERYSLAELAGAAGAELIVGSLAGVDAARRVARTEDGSEIAYDALLIATGAIASARYEHTTTVDDVDMDALLRGLVQDVEQGYLRRLAIVVPTPPPWPLPAYELALMASERAWDMQTELTVTLLTPERRPLEAFGEAVSDGLGQLLRERHIDLVTSAHCEVPSSTKVQVHPSGRTVETDRIVALPQLRGPQINGLPCDGGGFIPVDRYGRVPGAERVWAAGDVTDSSIKQGGMAAGVADVAAHRIAHLAGARVEVQPYIPVLQGVLLTGGTPRYLRARPAWSTGDGESIWTELDPEMAPPKVSAHYLMSQLEQIKAQTASAAR
jgi:sulfide:quinone oxidoreductase